MMNKKLLATELSDRKLSRHDVEFREVFTLNHYFVDYIDHSTIGLNTMLQLPSYPRAKIQTLLINLLNILD